MNSSISRPKITARRIAPIVGNRHKHPFDPRTMDEILHALNLLLDLRVVIVDQSNPRKNVLMLSDSRAVLPLAIPVPASVFLSTWHVKEHRGDYLLCVSWDGKTEGTSQTKIAKPNTLRASLTDEILPDLIENLYSSFDSTAQSRHCEGSDGTSEDQFITPRYMIADGETNKDHVIYAVSTNTFAKDEDGKDITLMDMNPQGRAFAAPQ